MRLRMCNHTEGKFHDCEYVDARDALVPVAAAVADGEVPQPEPGASHEARRVWSRRWDAAFHRAMGRLALS